MSDTSLVGVKFALLFCKSLILNNLVWFLTDYRFGLLEKKKLLVIMFFPNHLKAA